MMAKLTSLIELIRQASITLNPWLPPCRLIPPLTLIISLLHQPPHKRALRRSYHENYPINDHRFMFIQMAEFLEIGTFPDANLEPQIYHSKLIELCAFDCHKLRFCNIPFNKSERILKFSNMQSDLEARTYL